MAAVTPASFSTSNGARSAAHLLTGPTTIHVPELLNPAKLGGSTQTAW